MKIIKLIIAVIIGLGLTSSGFADDEFFKFYSIGQVHKVGLRNTSTECKIAVINFTYGSGRHELKEFKVAGKASTEVDIKGTTMTEIIDHKDCK